MKKRFGIAIIGGTGYGAGELLRLLAHHPHIEAAAVVSRSQAGRSVASTHTHLLGISSLQFEESLPNQWNAPYERSAVVLALPSGRAVTTMRDLRARDIPTTVSFIDLSGDLRLSSQTTHEAFYPECPFEPELRSQFVYGLTELAATTIRDARFITNPGCLATAAILALKPLGWNQIVAPIVVDAKTGTSGAGREPQASMHHPSRSADFTAYKALQHRHEPEILQALGRSFSSESEMMFIPHLIPIPRGVLVTAYATLREPIARDTLMARYRDTYKSSPFIRFRESPPRVVDVVGTNFCDLHIVTRGRQVVVMSAIDNLGKGMAGQCIQNLNLMFGLPQETGLLLPALGPV